MIHIPNIMLNFFLTAYTFWSLPSTVCRYIQGLGHLHKQSYIPANVKHEIINNSEFLSIIHLYLVPYTHIQVCIPKNQQHLCRKYSSMNLKGIARPTMQKKKMLFLWQCLGLFRIPFSLISKRYMHQSFCAWCLWCCISHQVFTTTCYFNNPNRQTEGELLWTWNRLASTAKRFI